MAVFYNNSGEKTCDMAWTLHINEGLVLLIIKRSAIVLLYYNVRKCFIILTGVSTILSIINKNMIYKC